jgi:hypothetical protein
MGMKRLKIIAPRTVSTCDSTLLKVFYTDTFPIPLPEKHNFPKDKYLLLRNRLSASLADRLDMQIPEPASDEAILLNLQNLSGQNDFLSVDRN